MCQSGADVYPRTVVSVS